MARKRRTSQVLETARQRLAGLKSIEPEPDLGSALTVVAYEAKASGFDTRLSTYNQHLAAVDDEQNSVDTDEADLRDWNRRILSAVEGRFGADSSEYEAVGGTRTSERKRPGRKPAEGPRPTA